MPLPLEKCRLYTFIDTAYLGSRAADDVARELCDGGSDIIQLRAKGASSDEIVRLAELVLPILQRDGVSLVINDHWDIACKVGADYCHFGQEDFFDAGLRHSKDLRSPEFSKNLPQLGLSTHAPEQARRSLAAEPAYIAIGPVYATPTKPSAKAVTLEYVRWAKENVSLPWFAIGGINLENVNDVLASGATRICVVSAILKSARPAEACRQFRNILESQTA